MNIHLKEFKPADHLKPYIHSYKQGVFNTYALSLLNQQVVPHGFVDLIIHLDDRHCDLVFDRQWQQSPDFTIIGMWTQPYTVRFRYKVEVFWIRFHPEGLHRLFGVPATAICNNQAAIRELTGNTFHQLCEQVREATGHDTRVRIVEAFLQKQLQKHRTGYHDYVQTAAGLIRQNHELTIDDICRQVYISPRQLERGFKEKLGISPKMYLRMARISEAYRLLQEGKKISFANISYSCGFADQAHFIREFKSFTGETPAVFMNAQEQYFVSL